jgi:Uri superfamily endonuclease
MTMKNTRRLPRSAVFVPPLEHWPAAGVYQLWLRVPVDLRVTIGRLGRFTFPVGVYVYTGRASRGLAARVLRHVNGARRKRWHIDYLLARREVHVERLVLASNDPDDECVVNQTLASKAECIARRFGASDCRAGCEAHLWRVGR